MSDLPRSYERFQDEYPDVWKSYEKLGEIAATSGPLDQKTRELIKLGMAAATGSESAVHSHTHRAMEIGVSAEEIEHAILVGITTMGFPRMMAALSWAKAAIKEQQG